MEFSPHIMLGLREDSSKEFSTFRAALFYKVWKYRNDSKHDRSWSALDAANDLENFVKEFLAVKEKREPERGGFILLEVGGRLGLMQCVKTIPLHWLASFGIVKEGW